VSDTLPQPCIVVLGREGRQAQAQLPYGGEEAHPKQVFLEPANGALGDPIAGVYRHHQG